MVRLVKSFGIRMKIIVGSNNPVKLAAVTQAFQLVFAGMEHKFIACSVESGVASQPIGATETRLGAANRANECRRLHPEADYYVGLEGGLEEIDGVYWVIAWMCIQNSTGMSHYGSTGSFVLPETVSTLIRNGVELGHASDQVFSAVNSKHHGGAVGILTNGIITRTDFYRPAVIFALVPFINPVVFPT